MVLSSASILLKKGIQKPYLSYISFNITMKINPFLIHMNNPYLKSYRNLQAPNFLVKYVWLYLEHHFYYKKEFSWGTIQIFTLT